LATLGLSLLHGQALAGLGLLASMATPALIASNAPNPWILFGYLVLTWLATLLASRLRRWLIAPSLANGLLSLWPLLYITFSPPVHATPVPLAMLAMVPGPISLCPGRYPIPEAVRDDTAPMPPEGRSLRPGAGTEGAGFLPRQPLGMTLTASIGAL